MNSPNPWDKDVFHLGIIKSDGSVVIDATNKENVNSVLNMFYGECKYCDGGDYCCIWLNPLDGEYYLDIETNEWDEYEEDYVHLKEYISFCPYCGRKLKRTWK